jgi:hypothetical protein
MQAAVSGLTVDGDAKSYMFAGTLKQAERQTAFLRDCGKVANVTVRSTIAPAFQDGEDESYTITFWAVTRQARPNAGRKPSNGTASSTAPAKKAVAAK